MEMSWYFSSLRKPSSLVCCKMFCVNRLPSVSFHGRYIRCLCTFADGLTVRCNMRGKKNNFWLKNSPKETNELWILHQCAGLAGSSPSRSSLPASTFGNEMWEMGQFTAKGCFFLRDADIKMEHRWYAEVDGKRDEGFGFRHREGEKKS